MQGKFKEAKLTDYLEWLKQYLKCGKPTDYFPNEPFEKWPRRFMVVRSPFVLDGEMGGYAENIIVPRREFYLSENGNLGDNRLYFVEHGEMITSATWVPVFSNPEFLKLPKIEAFIRGVPAERCHR